MTLSNKKINKILENLEMGHSVRDIAKKCNVDKNTILKYKNQYFRRSIQNKQTSFKLLPENKPAVPAIGQIQYVSVGAYQPSFQNTPYNQYPNYQNYNSMNTYNYWLEQQRRNDENIIEFKKELERGKKLDAEIRDIRKEIYELQEKEKRDAVFNYLQFQMDMLKKDQEFNRKQIESSKNFSARIDESNIKSNDKSEIKPVLYPRVNEPQDEENQEKQVEILEQDSRELEEKSEFTVFDAVIEPSVKDKEYDESDEIQVSDSIILPIFSFSTYILGKLWKFSNTAEAKLPKNDPNYWKKFSEIMRER